MIVDRQLARAVLGVETVAATEVSLTFDRQWSPYVQGTAELAGIYDVDPDALERFRVRLEQRFSDGLTAAEIAALWAPESAQDLAIEFAPMTAAQIAAQYEQQLNADPFPSTYVAADLLVRDVELDLRARTTRLTLASDDMRLFDAALVSTSPLPFSATSVRAIVESVLERLGVALAPGDADGELDEPPILSPGQTYRDFLNPLMQQAGLRLYADERRVWQLVDADEQLDGGLTLSTSRDVSEATPQLDREAGGYDSVVIEYRWTVEPDQFVSYDVAGPPRPRKTLKLTYQDTPYPGPGAAAGVLKRMSRRRRNVPVTAAPNYTARPTMAARLVSAALPQQSGRISRVTFNYPARTMLVDIYDLEQLEPQSVRAIPPNIQTDQLVGQTDELNPGSM